MAKWMENLFAFRRLRTSENFQKFVSERRKKNQLTSTRPVGVATGKKRACFAPRPQRHSRKSAGQRLHGHFQVYSCRIPNAANGILLFGKTRPLPSSFGPSRPSFPSFVPAGILKSENDRGASTGRTRAWRSYRLQYGYLLCQFFTTAEAESVRQTAKPQKESTKCSH